MALPNEQCPYCDSDHVEGYQVEVEGLNAIQEMVCYVCERMYHTVYTFVENVKWEETEDAN